MRIFNIKINTSVAAVYAVLLCIAALTTSCDKDDKDNDLQTVPGVTSIRLVHSSEISASSVLDLYVDDVKVTDQGVAFPLASDYFSAASGADKRIEVRKGTDVISRDTIDIREGHQYSVFVKELQSGIFDESNPPKVIQEIDIKKLIVTSDNNTTVPATGTAKVRFVNAVTTGEDIRAAGGTKGATFVRVNPPGPYPDVEYLTYNLADMGSDFVTMRPGAATFRAIVPNYAVVPGNVNVNMAETILEPGKLYAVYLVGSPGAPGIPSTMQLKIVPIN